MNENSEKTVVIAETADGKYRLRNNGISKFALIGILECVVFDLKTESRGTAQIAEPESFQPRGTAQEQKEAAKANPVQEVNREESSGREAEQKSKTPDLRTRISNAVKAIRNLGGEVEENVDRTNATEEELQTELGELTNQYKRLKSSKGK